MDSKNTAHTRKAKNPTPDFERVKTDKPQLPFLTKLRNYVHHCAFKPSAWVGFALMKQSHQFVVKDKEGNYQARQRQMREERQKALEAFCRASAQYVDLVSFHVRRDITQLAKECGLVTESEAGNLSITRLSRLVEEFLVQHGLAEKNLGGPQIWDPIEKYYISAFVTVTPKFFEMCGISEDELWAEREKRMDYIKLGVDECDAGCRSLRVVQQKAMQAHVREAFKRRREANKINKKSRLAKRLEKMSNAEQLEVCAQRVIARADKSGNLDVLDTQMLTELALQERSMLLKHLEYVNKYPPH